MLKLPNNLKMTTNIVFVVIMVDFSSIPVIDVQMDNVEEMWPVILQAIKESSFTAIDFVSSNSMNFKTVLFTLLVIHK